MHVLILHDIVAAGAPPDAGDVLEQASAIEAALRRRGDTTERFACTRDLAALRRRLTHAPPDLVFNLVESLEGRGALIAAAPEVVEACGLAMTGCPADAVRVTSGKLLAKERLGAAGLPTPAWRTEEDLRAGRTFPPEVDRVIVKSVWEHASIGIGSSSVISRSVSRDADDASSLAAALAARRDALGGEAFVEAFVAGREFNLSLLEHLDRSAPQVLPPAEIDFVDWPEQEPRIVGYAAKWDPQSRAYHDTPRRFDFAPADAALLDRLASLACACWGALGLRGYARVDFRVDEGGGPWILEINANPCLSPDAGFAAALGAARIPFDEAVDRVISAAQRGVDGRR